MLSNRLTYSTSPQVLKSSKKESKKMTSKIESIDEIQVEAQMVAAFVAAAIVSAVSIAILNSIKRKPGKQPRGDFLPGVFVFLFITLSNLGLIYYLKHGHSATIGDLVVASHSNAPMPFSSFEPVISIVTSCFNQSIYLQDAAHSVIQQQYIHWEWLIVNDQSPDDCLVHARQVASEFPQYRIRVFDKPNSGAADSRNFGIQRAFGSWICLLDADDILNHQYLEEVANVIKSNSRVTAVNSNQQFFGESQWSWDLAGFSTHRIKYQGLFPLNTVFRRWDLTLNPGGIGHE